IPLEILRSLPELPHIGHDRLERERIPLFRDVALRHLLFRQHGVLLVRRSPSRDVPPAALRYPIPRSARALARPWRVARSALAPSWRRPVRALPFRPRLVATRPGRARGGARCFDSLRGSRARACRARRTSRPRGVARRAPEVGCRERTRRTERDAACPRRSNEAPDARPRCPHA